MKKDAMPNIDYYKPHQGTIRICGATIPKEAGGRAFRLLEADVKTIDFTAIGGNANQQAMKAMGIFMLLVQDNYARKQISVAFQPLRFLTMTEEPGGGSKAKDLTVWRTVLFTRNEETNTSRSSG